MTLPGPQDVYSPRVSPDGRFIVALDTPGNHKLMLFDRQNPKWFDLLAGRTSSPGWPQWSKDSKHVYFSLTSSGLTLYRVGIGNRKIERVAAVGVPEGTTGVWGGGWYGIAPDGSPLLLRDRSIQEIYALDVDLP